MRWAIITGLYPPQVGGVSDYSQLVARALVQAGDEVHVWTSTHPGAAEDDAGVAVHRLPGHFGPRALARLHRELNRPPRPHRVLVQYVPHAFGAKAMNLPFCIWLYARRRDDLFTMFHEVAFPFETRQAFTHRVLAAVTHLMAALVVRASHRVFIAIPAWERMLRRVSGAAARREWLPVPSNIATSVDADALSAMRVKLGLRPGETVVGHFGTYSSAITEILDPVLARLLAGDSNRRVLLLGRGGDGYAATFVVRHPAIRERVVAPGGLTTDALAAQIACCDLLIQPYPDGVSSRRTSAMAALALGRAIVTTEGPLSEPLWQETGAVSLVPLGSAAKLAAAAETLLHEPDTRALLGERAAQVYAEHFGIERTVRALRR